VDKLETCISRAEIAWKSGHSARAIRHATRAIELCNDPRKTTALKIFIARAKSSLGKYAESNEIYRALIDENTYLPPIILGLLYNNFKTASLEKQKCNINLIKLYLK
jgi:hypothetical protein